MAAAPLDELPGWALELVGAARVGRLGMIDDHGGPRVLPVTFARAGGALWSAVDHKPKRRPGDELARVRFLRSRPAASLCVDRYEDDWSRLAWVQLLGSVAVLDGDDAPADALAALREKYPPYREQPPLGPFLRLDVARALCWRA